MYIFQIEIINLTKIIRWDGRNSDAIKMQQGLSQGAHNSPSQYLLQNNSNLNALDNHSSGYHLGHIKITNATVADDELLMSEYHADAQTPKKYLFQKHQNI